MATYYVDATGGSDSHDGLSSGAAWQTIGKLNLTTFASGDTVLFKRGETWTGTLWTAKGAGALTIADYGSGALPIIDGNHAVECVVIDGVNGVTAPLVFNLDIRNAPDGGAMKLHALTGQFLVEGCNFQGNAFTSNGGALIIGSCSAGLTPNWQADTPYYTSPLAALGALVTGGVAGLASLATNRSVSRTANGIAIGSAGRVTGCTFSNNGNDGIWCSDTPDLEIDNNTISGVSSSLSDGIQLDGTSTPVTTRYCSNYWIHHNTIDMTGTNSLKGCITTNQQVNDLNYTGGLIEWNATTAGSWGTSASNNNSVTQFNFIQNCVPGTQPNQGCIGTAAATGFHTDGQTWRYNVCLNCARHLYLGPSSWGPTNIKAYNNTFVGGDYRIVWCETGTTGTIKNNIIVAGGTTSDSMRLETVIVDDYNCLYPEYTNFINVQGTNYSTMAAYQAASRGLHSTSANPTLDTNGHPLPGSPVLAAGVDLSGSGLWMAPFSGAPNIGALDLASGGGTDYYSHRRNR